MSRRTRLAAAGLLAAAAVSLRPAGDPLVSGPLLQDLSATEACLVLHTAAAERLDLFLESEAGGETRRSSDAIPVRRHVFWLRDLRPATRWRYRIADVGGKVRGAGSFATPMAGARRLRFAALGDTGRLPWWVEVGEASGVEPAPWLEDLLPGRGDQWPVARAVRAARPELVLHLGDVVYPAGRLAHYPEAFLRPFALLAAEVPVYLTLGNHDLMTEIGGPFLYVFEPPQRARLGGRYYGFVRGPVQFLCLDTFSSSLEAGTPQRVWLEAELRAAAAPWRVVFTHRPFHTASRSRLDPENRFLREQVHPLLAAAGPTLVLSGHDHVYQRFAPIDGVHYVVAGAGGKSIYELDTAPGLVASAQTYCFVLVEVEDRRLRLQARTPSGRVLDEVVVP